MINELTLQQPQQSQKDPYSTPEEKPHLENSTITLPTGGTFNQVERSNPIPETIDLGDGASEGNLSSFLGKNDETNSPIHQEREIVQILQDETFKQKIESSDDKSSYSFTLDSEEEKLDEGSDVGNFGLRTSDSEEKMEKPASTVHDYPKNPEAGRCYKELKLRSAILEGDVATLNEILLSDSFPEVDVNTIFQESRNKDTPLGLAIKFEQWDILDALLKYKNISIYTSTSFINNTATVHLLLKTASLRKSPYILWFVLNRRFSMGLTREKLDSKKLSDEDKYFSYFKKFSAIHPTISVV